MGTYSSYKTDQKLELEGSWYTAEDGSRWKLRHLASKPAFDAYNLARKPYLGLIRQAEVRGMRIPIEMDQKIVVDALVAGMVVGWSGVTNEQDDEIEFDKTVLRKVLSDLPNLAAELLRAAGDFHNYLESLKTEEIKNSSAPSSMSLNGDASSISSTPASLPENPPQA